MFSQEKGIFKTYDYKSCSYWFCFFQFFVFFQEESSVESAFGKMFSNIQNIKTPNAIGYFIKEDFSLMDLIAALDANFGVYLGSQTHPPCTTGIRWLVARNTIPVGSQDVNKLFLDRNLYTWVWLFHLIFVDETTPEAGGCERLPHRAKCSQSATITHFLHFNGRFIFKLSKNLSKNSCCCYLPCSEGSLWILGTYLHWKGLRDFWLRN